MVQIGRSTPEEFSELPPRISPVDQRDFQSYIMCEWKPNPVDKYAFEYHQRCERFDESIARKDANGNVLPPHTNDEFRRINRNAQLVIAELSQQVMDELHIGYQEARRQLQTAIQSTQRDFERMRQRKKM